LISQLSRENSENLYCNRLCYDTTSQPRAV
jgi:hypothetical protein